MFKVDVSKTYKYTVNVTMLGDNGKTVKSSFTGIFNRLAQTDLDRLVGDMAKPESTDEAIVQEILAGWEGVKDIEGQEIEFNEGNRRIVCDIYPVRARIIEAWSESLQEVSRKN